MLILFHFYLLYRIEKGVTLKARINRVIVSRPKNTTTVSMRKSRLVIFAFYALNYEIYFCFLSKEELMLWQNINT
jgi:hypothetical protein